MQVTAFPLLALGGLVAVAITPPAVAGTEYEFEVSDRRLSRIGVEWLRVEGSKLRLDRAPREHQERGRALIFRGERENPRLVVVDGQGGHVIVDQEAIARLAAEARPEPRSPGERAIAIAWAEADAIADPQARARRLAVLAERFGPRPADAGIEADALQYVELEPGEMAGYPCARYEVRRAGIKVEEIWVTDWTNVDGGGEMRQAIELFGEFYGDLLASLAGMAGATESILGRADNPAEHMLKLGRFLVATDEYEDSALVRRSALKSVARVAHQPGVFRPDPSSAERPFG